VDDARRAILRRRAKFVAAALATVGAGGIDAVACKQGEEPKPVDAEMRPVTTASASAGVAEPETDAGSDVREDVRPISAPCLSPKRWDAGPSPAVCLRK